MNTTQHTAMEWDVETWGRALIFWTKIIEKQGPKLSKGLEIGSRHGGLSWFFAQKYGSQMCCTDYDLPSEQAKLLHQKSGMENLISYQQADATRLPFPDQSFDFVVFKSVLGAVGRNNQAEKQQQAIQEIYRVLRPGGLLFFAENLRGSALHQWARRVFMPWGKSWRYVTIAELSVFFAPYWEKEIRATGFLAAFISRPAWLKSILTWVDAGLFFVPQSWRYVGYGFARKGA
jgi:ubiquinone/menaquinone biosynthesis C-methylase UbiE